MRRGSPKFFHTFLRNAFSFIFVGRGNAVSPDGRIYPVIVFSGFAVSTGPRSPCRHVLFIQLNLPDHTKYLISPFPSSLNYSKMSSWRGREALTMIDDFILDLKRRLTENNRFGRGISALIDGESLTLDGMVGDFPLLFLSLLAEQAQRLILVIVPNIGETEQMVDSLSAFTEVPILTFPILPAGIKMEDEEESEIFLSEDRIFGERLRVLKELEKRSSPEYSLIGRTIPAAKTPSTEKKSPLGGFLTKKDQNGGKSAPLAAAVQKEGNPLILVTTLAAIRQPVPTRAEIDAGSRILRLGERSDRDELLRWLVDGGFHPTSAVELPGEYSVRGGILDIFAIDWEKPVRIEYFGDEIESIRPFETQTQRSDASIDSILLTRLRPGRAADDSASPKTSAASRFIDHLPNETIVFLSETDRIIEQATKLEKFAAASESNERKTSKSSAKEKADVRPLTIAETLNTLYARPTIHSVAIASGNELSDRTVRFELRSVDRFAGNVISVREELDRADSSRRIGIVCRTEAEIRRLHDSLEMTIPAKEGRIYYLTGPPIKGFEWPDESVTLIGTDELFRRTALRRPTARPMTRVIDSFIDLSPGDLVIHVAHGLARFRGLKTITKGQQEEEHLELEFADNVTLFVPTSKISLVQKYVGTSKANPKLAKLNGKSWAKQKKEVQEAVFDLAMEMLELQAQRESLVGTAFPPDSDWQRDFDESFPFDETPDQLDAIEAIKEDMQRTRPMDRLLCGDVGFGKTEVAVRAAFKAVDAGFQVAVLVPTTILAEQHYRVFSERMAGFPVRVGALSRFTDRKSEIETLQGLRDGSIDVVIGTHRLVQKDIAFRNLGLVVIDEEQRFGVRDKEHLKRLRSMVDVLTMTATPIPRTLHFSLVGLRDISNLRTPPLDRLPIETKVQRFNPESIRRVILGELGRGGQVYFLHNRVRDINDMAHKLQNIVPEARIAVGHAQMPDDELEEVMRDFILHRFDVLLCTTIIESGLDIPNVNTIFINYANRFGLAELHQLRGRVGRSSRQAYCRLLIEPNAPMTGDSLKRLRAIEEYSQLGAGFHLALRDLEIRGAGNILGTQQSGHIALVGYEMYCDFLESAVRALKNEPQRVKIEVEMDLPGTTVIPKSYISDQRAKIDLYRRIVRVARHDELKQIREEIVDRFGPAPAEVERMFLCAEIRIEAFRHHIRSVQLSDGPGGWYVGMRFMAPETIARLKKLLEPLNISLRITDGQRAYIPVPKSFLDADGRPDPDHLLRYVKRALEAGRDDSNSSVD